VYIKKTKKKKKKRRERERERTRGKEENARNGVSKKSRREEWRK